MSEASCRTTDSILTHELDCGALLLMEPNPSVRSAALSWWVPSGTAHDPAGPDRDGLAVLCAEMLERGAGGLDSRAFNERLDACGVLREVSVHSTVTRVSASLRGEHLAETLGLMADLVLRPKLPADAMEPVRSLCLQSIEGLKDDPAGQAGVALHHRALPAPLNRSTYGCRQVIETADIESVRAAWSERSRPVGSIISVAGSFDPVATRELLEGLLSEWSGAPPELAELDAPIGGDQHLPQESAQVHLEIGLDAPRVEEEDELPFLAGVRTLGAGASSRLFESVRERRGLCYDVHAHYSATARFGLCTIGAGTTPERIGQTIDCIFEELEAFGREGVRPEEFDRVRRGLKTRLLMQGESTSARAFALAHDQHQRGAPRSLADIAARIDGLTHERVDEVVRRRMDAAWIESPVRVAVGPDSPFDS